MEIIINTTETTADELQVMSDALGKLATLRAATESEIKKRQDRVEAVIDQLAGMADKLAGMANAGVTTATMAEAVEVDATPVEEKPAKKTRKPAATQPAAETAHSAPAQTEPAAESPSEPVQSEAPPVALEDVRAKLAALSQSGKTAEVKQLLQQFGATRLTDVAPENFTALMAAAEEI